MGDAKATPPEASSRDSSQNPYSKWDGWLSQNNIQGQDQIQGLTLQSDGKIIATGISRRNNNGAFDCFVSRYLANGELDSSFGTGGTAVTRFSVEYTECKDVKVQADGKIVAVGRQFPDSTYNNGSIFVVRFTSSGVLDSGFGTGGYISLIVANRNAAGAVQILPNQKILVIADKILDYESFAILIRLNSDGSVDTSFGTNGIAGLSLDATGYQCFSSLIYNSRFQSDGKILVSGGYQQMISSNAYSLRAFVARFNPDGTPDSAFGSGGIVKDTRAGPASGLDVQSDGKTVIAAILPADQRASVFRYLSDGAVDSSFGVGGVASVPLDTHSSSSVGKVVVQSDGKIVLSGGIQQVAGTVSHKVATLNRYLTDGRVDTSFGVNGLRTFDSNDGLTDWLGYSMILGSANEIYYGGAMARNNLFGDSDSFLIQYVP
ncbi:MAG: hypothetical protein ACXWOH_03970 [Bdellovibrionota bacterium]